MVRRARPRRGRRASRASSSVPSESGTSDSVGASLGPSRATRSRCRLVDQERAAYGRAGLLVEDAVRLRRGTVRPEVRRERVARRRAPASTPGGSRTVSHETRTTSVSGAGERLEVLLQIEGLLVADGVNANGWKTSSTFVAAEEVAQPHARAVSFLQIEVRSLRHLSTIATPWSSSPRRRSRRAIVPAVRAAPPGGTSTSKPAGSSCG